MNSKIIAQKIEVIKKDLCSQWSEKITRALFPSSKSFGNGPSTPRNRANVTDEQVPKDAPATPVAPLADKQDVAQNTDETPKDKTQEPQPQPTVSDAPTSDKPVDTTPIANTTTTEPPKTADAPKAAVPQEPEERIITVEFDWNSFNDLFSSLINEGASEVIDTIMDSLVSKDCAISLLSSLLDHCKLLANESDAVLKLSKHEQIRAFLQQNLKKYIIKYSDDPREWGYFKDGVLCDVVEIDVTDDEEINWIFRDVTQNIENCTDLQQYIITKYYIPFYRRKIGSVMHKDIVIDVDWGSIDYAAQDYAKAVYTIYHEQSAFVLDEVFRAFEWISMYETDELVDAIAVGINKVNIALQPGHDSTRKDFDIDDIKKTLSLRLCLEADEFAGVFRNRDLVPIVKIAGLYNTDYSKVFKFDLLSAAANIFKVPRGDLSMFSSILGRSGFFTQPTQQDLTAIEGCKKFMDRYYKEKLQRSSETDSKKDKEGAEDGDEEEEEEEYEKIIKGWHVIKFNKMNYHQERFLILTNKAYWTFKFDFKEGKVDEKHYKRHDLLDFCVVDIGTLEQTDKFDIQALKIFTREKRKPDIFGNPYQEVVAVDNTQGKPKKTKVSVELRKSLKLKQTTSGELNIFGGLKGSLDFDTQHPPRQKKTKAAQERPSVANCYNSVFLPYGSELDIQQLKDILTEISWCLYAAAVARQRTRGAEPFMNQVLTRPKETFASFVYNVLGLGIVGKMKNPAQQKMSISKVFGTLTGGNVKTTNGDDQEKPKIQEFQTHEPSKTPKVVKPILKKAGAEPKKQDMHIQFRPEVQVFYTDEEETE